MSVSEEHPSSSTTASLGMAREALAEGPHWATKRENMYFMLVDAHSKWPKVVEMRLLPLKR